MQKFYSLISFSSLYPKGVLIWYFLLQCKRPCSAPPRSSPGRGIKRSEQASHPPLQRDPTLCEGCLCVDANEVTICNLHQIIISCLPWLPCVCWHRRVGGAARAAGGWCPARGQWGLAGADHVPPFTTRHTTCWADRCWLCWCPWAMKPGCPSSWHLYLDLSGFLNWYNMKNVTLCYCMCVSHGYPLSTMPWPRLPCFLQLMGFAIVMGYCFPQFFKFILQFKCFWTWLQLDCFPSTLTTPLFLLMLKNLRLHLNKAQLLKPK